MKKKISIALGIILLVLILIITTIGGFFFYWNYQITKINEIEALIEEKIGNRNTPEDNGFEQMALVDVDLSDDDKKLFLYPDTASENTDVYVKKVDGEIKYVYDTLTYLDPEVTQTERFKSPSTNIDAIRKNYIEVNVEDWGNGNTYQAFIFNSDFVAAEFTNGNNAFYTSTGYRNLSTSPTTRNLLILENN